MDWVAIIGAVLGSSVLTTLINNWAKRKKTDAEANSINIQALRETVQDLSRRVLQLEARLARMEERDSIWDRTVNRAYRCKHEDCPVLEYWESHPLPPKIYTVDNEQAITEG